MNDGRGGAPVGLLSELGDMEAAAVLYLRLWSDGPTAQAEVWRDFSMMLGAEKGRSALRALEALCDLCIRYGRRPLMRHQVTCRCLGADEACFANLVAAATEGEREDALLMAMMIVRADIAPSLTALAQTVGFALKRMALRTQARGNGSLPAKITVH